MNRVEEIWTRSTTRQYVRDGRVSLQDMEMLFEAATRAPSSYNMQPWRFWYAKAGSLEWEKLLALLVKVNAAWAVNADWLVLVGSYQFYEFRGTMGLNTHASFDTGAACMNFALSASAAGFGCAIVGGFDYEKAKEIINNENIEPQVMMVVGSRVASVEEKAPRKSLSETVFSQF